MAQRKVIAIDQDKCNGCANCIPNCPEGAIQIIDQKAHLISDLFCDGLGACLGFCPQGAIRIEEREALPYDEKKVMANIVKHGQNVIKAHLKHLQDHDEKIYLKQALDFLNENKIKVNLTKLCDHGSEESKACPGARAQDLRKPQAVESGGSTKHFNSELGQWPVQLRLVPTQAPYFQGARVLIAADCVPFAYANFHQDLLKGKILLVGCPKLDDLQLYKEKLEQIFKNNDILDVVYAHIEVPCCSGLLPVIKEVISKSGKDIPFNDITISIRGEKIK